MLSAPTYRILPQFSESTVKEVLNFLSPAQYNGTDKNIARITSLVCSVIGVSPSLMKKKDRHNSVVHARHILFYIFRKETTMSLAEIGWKVGHKDHASVLHAVRNVENALDGFNPELLYAYNRVKNERSKIQCD